MSVPPRRRLAASLALGHCIALVLPARAADDGIRGQGVLAGVLPTADIAPAARTGMEVLPYSGFLQLGLGLHSETRVINGALAGYLGAGACFETGGWSVDTLVFGGTRFYRAYGRKTLTMGDEGFNFWASFAGARLIATRPLGFGDGRSYYGLMFGYDEDLRRITREFEAAPTDSEPYFWERVPLESRQQRLGSGYFSAGLVLGASF